MQSLVLVRGGYRGEPAGTLTISMTLSAGVAVYGVDGLDLTSLLRSADTALYEAQRCGRNRVVAVHGSPEAQTAPGV